MFRPRVAPRGVQHRAEISDRFGTSLLQRMSATL